MDDDISDLQHLKKDAAYSPASDRETASRQADPHDSEADTADEAKVLPGTGGPDDEGDVEVDPADIHIPHEGGSR